MEEFRTSKDLANLTVLSCYQNSSFVIDSVFVIDGEEKNLDFYLKNSRDFRQ